jgi:pyrroloquinoline quinone (PQQ) biosynthesis protein C
MLDNVLPMGWLWATAQQCRELLRSHAFYQSVAKGTQAEDFYWIRQLYHLSADFTAATALRYGKCDDPRFRDAFAEHAAEEVEHPAQLAKWMHEFGFLKSDELPNSVPPNLATLSLGAYFIRSVMREPFAHQVITLNLMTESIAVDFYNQINPKLAELGFTPKGYWLVHQEADVHHQVLGLDLIPQCPKDSPMGLQYLRTVQDVATLWQQVLDSWNQLIQYPDPAGRVLPYRPSSAALRTVVSASKYWSPET